MSGRPRSRPEAEDAPGADLTLLGAHLVADSQPPAHPSTLPPVVDQRVAVTSGANNAAPPLPQSDNGAAVVVSESASWREGNEEHDPSFIGDLNPESTFLADKSPLETGPATDPTRIWLQRKPIHRKSNRSHQRLASVSGRDSLLSKLVFPHLC